MANEQLKRIQTLNVIVGGPFSSGKTSFIRSISEIEPDNVTLEGVIRNQKASYLTCTGRFTLDSGIIAHLYETPDGRRISDFVEVVHAMGMALGCVMMIDSAKPFTFSEAHRLIKYFSNDVNLSCVIAANKQDMPGAWPADALQSALSIPDDIPVIPCVATDKESVKGVLLALLGKVLEGINAEANSGE